MTRSTLLLLACWTAALAAQEPHDPLAASPAPNATQPPPGTQAPVALAALLADGVPLHDEGADPDAGPLGVWGAGADFKVGFADGAFVFVPYLGADAAALPWQWRTVAVTMGGEDLLGGDAAAEEFDARQFRRRRGLVTEVWDLRADAASQSFVVERPASAVLPKGELRIRGRIATPLAAHARGPAVEPLRFSAETGYSLLYGTATVFDAAGNQAAVPTSFDGEAITLHVPGDFVATAAWPLCVDPLLTPYGIANGSSLAFGEFEIDSTPGTLPGTQLAMTWTRSASIGDSDVYVFRAADDFTGAVLFGSEIGASTDSVEPTVAGNWIDSTLTVAWARLSQNGDRCYARSWSADTTSGSLANPILLTTQSGDSERRPRAAGYKEFTNSPRQVLIVRQRVRNGITEIVGSLFNSTTFHVPGTFAIGSPNTWVGDLREPTVTKSIRGDYEGWIVGFQFWSTTFARHCIGLKRVAYTGVVDGVGMSITLNDPDRHALRPRIDGAFGRFLVAYSTLPVATYPGQQNGGAGTTVDCQRIDWSATQQPRYAWPARTLHSSPGRSVSCDGVAVNIANYSHWLIGTKSGGRATITLTGYRGVPIEQHQLPGPTGSGTHVAQDVHVVYTPASERFAALYDHTTNGQGVLSWSCNGIVRTYPDLPPPLVYGSNCGTTAFLFFHDFRIGNERAGIGQTGFQPGDWAFVGVSLGSASLPFSGFGVAGGCTLHLDPAPGAWLGAFFVLANGAGYAELDLPLPETLQPIDLFAQFVHAGATPNALRASRGVRIHVR